MKYGIRGAAVLGLKYESVRELNCIIRLLRYKNNKTGTSQVGALSKAQKAQNIFFGKKLEIFEKKISFGKCRTVPKNVKGGTLFNL